MTGDGLLTILEFEGSAPCIILVFGDTPGTGTGTGTGIGIGIGAGAGAGARAGVGAGEGKGEIRAVYPRSARGFLNGLASP